MQIFIHTMKKTHVQLKKDQYKELHSEWRSSIVE